jgi:hypothetical protein
LVFGRLEYVRDVFEAWWEVEILSQQRREEVTPTFEM